MKKLICPECHKTRNYGKFCLDCGIALKEVITPDTKFNQIKTKRSPAKLKADIRNWLGRIGVQQPDLKINADSVEAQVVYNLKGKTYKFKSDMQDGEANNLAAVEQFLHGRVLGIERGIETEEQAFAGYEALPYYKKGEARDPYQVLGFKEKVEIKTARAKYKKLAKMCHPDVNTSVEAANQFRDIKKAMEEIEKKEEKL